MENPIEMDDLEVTPISGSLQTGILLITTCYDTSVSLFLLLDGHCCFFEPIITGDINEGFQDIRKKDDITSNNSHETNFGLRYVQVRKWWGPQAKFW